MLQILDYPWHQAHLHRLTVLPAQFTIAAIREPRWNTAQRPIPPNVRFLDAADLDPAAYDLALLHLDQWCDRLNVRAANYRLMNQTTRAIPQVVIMHGTPDGEANRRALLRLIGDRPVVCNSHQAAREWDGGEGRRDRYGLPQFRAIRHGYRDEFSTYPLARRRGEVATVCSGSALSREYHGLPLLERLARDVPLAWYGPAGNRAWFSSYAAYRDMLASSLIYLNPTRRGPMPGARTEALLSGCCVVTVPGHDVEEFLIDGHNGFVVDTYAQARDVLRALLNEPARAFQVGQQGRCLARQSFSAARYVADWLDVLQTLGVEVPG